MDIPKETRDKIRAEEIFREEVRNELNKAKEKTRWQSIWSFLNSPLTLWLLTTVVATMLVSWFQERSRARQAAHEVTYRLNEAEMALYEFRSKAVAASSQNRPIEIPNTKEICELILQKLNGAHIENQNGRISSSSSPDLSGAPMQSLIVILLDAGLISKEEKERMETGITDIKKEVGDAIKFDKDQNPDHRRFLARAIYDALSKMRTSKQPRMLFSADFFSAN